MNNLLPVFMNIDDESCLVIGGGKVAEQKINQLLECKALVRVVSPKISDYIESLPVTIINRSYRSSDLDDIKLVFATTDNKQVNQKIFRDAKKRDLPINVSDQPQLCSFYMGSVHQDGDLKVAVSTNGKCPSFGIYIKEHINNISKGLWGKALNELAIKREKIIKTLSTYTEKKKVMDKLVRGKFKGVSQVNRPKGKVFLIGAGPGDPELITIKGLKAIQNADVILHDALVHPHLVFELNPLAKKIFVGKRADKHSVSQETIYSIMAEEAMQGKQVVRLKGGDPFIFGRGGEEAMSLAIAGIIFEVVPGVTAAIGAAASFGIPLTHRDTTTSMLFITGHQCSNADYNDWQILAKLNATLVFYMGMKRIGKIIHGLIENGKSVYTPVAIVHNATMTNQTILTSTLNNLHKDINKIKAKTPSIIIIGEVVKYYTKLKECLNTLPSRTVEPIEDLGLDIWSNERVSA